MVDWVQAFTLLVVAILGTVVWSIVDRRRDELRAAQQVVPACSCGFASASTMIGYGMVKAIPLQMPAPGLHPAARAVRQLLADGRAVVLDRRVAALRDVRRLMELHRRHPAVRSAARHCSARWSRSPTAVQIFTLNMTYDVPVKLFSFHLILMSLVLIAPEASRLANVLVFNRTGGAVAAAAALPRPSRWRSVALAVQLGYGGFLVGWTPTPARTRPGSQHGGGAPKSPLYGIWNIETMTIDGADALAARHRLRPLAARLVPDADRR